MKKTKLLDKVSIEKAITRLSHEIIESNSDLENLVVVGILSRGEIIANRIIQQIKKLKNVSLKYGTLDVTFHRDDYRTNLGSPKVGVSDINFDVNEKDIVLIDDVLYTGRTIRAAMDEIFTYGRPNSIRLAVMVDRGHRELPIKAEFVGKNFPTADDEHIHVLIKEMDSEDLIYLEKES